MTVPMSEALLIEEAGDRAAGRLLQLLTLVMLSFDEGEARARALMLAQPERIIDPVASACFAEARGLLMRAGGSRGERRVNLFAALFALDVAARAEPECYAATHRAIRALGFAALDEAVARELAGARSDSDAAEAEPLASEPSGN
jgi:hypothetical protein